MCPPVLAVAAIGMTLAASAQAASAQQAAANAQASQVQYVANNEKVLADRNAQVVENTGEYNAQVVENNIKVLQRAEADSIQRGADSAAEARRQTRQSNAMGRAMAGSSGTVADTGTNLDLQIQNKMEGEITALTVMNGAEREAYGYKLDAIAEENRAKGIRYTSKEDATGIRAGADVGVANASYAAQNYRYAGALNAQTTLVTGFSSAAGMAYRYGGDIFSGSARNPFGGKNA